MQCAAEKKRCCCFTQDIPTLPTIICSGCTLFGLLLLPCRNPNPAGNAGAASAGCCFLSMTKSAPIHAYTRTLNTLHRTLPRIVPTIVHYTLCTVHFTLCTIKCALHTIHYPLYTTHYTHFVYSVKLNSHRRSKCARV